jgi:hypothetical protein
VKSCVSFLGSLYQIAGSWDMDGALIIPGRLQQSGTFSNAQMQVCRAYRCSSPLLTYMHAFIHCYTQACAGKTGPPPHIWDSVAVLMDWQDWDLDKERSELHSYLASVGLIRWASARRRLGGQAVDKKIDTPWYRLPVCFPFSDFLFHLFSMYFLFLNHL